MRLLLLTVLFMSCFLFDAGSQQDYQVSVTTIQVWVTVEGTRQDLTEKDFELFEDGKKMALTCFERAPLVAVPEDESDPPEGSAAPEPPPATARAKRIVLMLDQLNTSQNEFLYLREKIDEFLDQLEGKADFLLAAVPPYEELTSFTRDMDEIRSRLNTFSASRDRDQRIAARRRDIRLALESMRKDRLELAYDIALEGKLEEEQNTGLVIDSLKDFHRSLSRRPQNDHTVAVLISGGLNSHPGQQYLDMVYRAAATLDEDTRYMQRARSDFDKAMQKALGVLNRDNVTVYTIHTRGRVPVVENIIENDPQYQAKTSEQTDYLEDYRQLLQQVAAETGGLWFRDSLNFKRGFDLILKDLDQQYLLCFTAPEHKDEGDYHRIKVVPKVKGLKLRHRAGYID